MTAVAQAWYAVSADDVVCISLSISSSFAEEQQPVHTWLAISCSSRNLACP